MILHVLVHFRPILFQLYFHFVSLSPNLDHFIVNPRHQIVSSIDISAVLLKYKGSLENVITVSLLHSKNEYLMSWNI
jgi:hypothetical protein